LAPTPPHQEVHFCTSSDGVRIAYAEVGKGIPLLRTGHWLTHLEYDWESPVWSSFLQEIAAGRRLIRYDARGNGPLGLGGRRDFIRSVRARSSRAS
jgi:hypothetical protein